MPEITIYITNHNYGRYLKKSIESVLTQTFTDFELLIIDDDSTDNSKKIIEQYRNNPRISIFYLNNRNHVQNANFALKQAKGKYFIRLDADDWIEKNALLILSGYLDKNKEVGAVFPGYYLAKEDEKIVEAVNRGEKSFTLSSDDKEPHGACTMICTDKLQNVGGYSNNINCMDGLDLWNKFKNKYQVISIPDVLFYYRQHGKNLTKNI